MVIDHWEAGADDGAQAALTHDHGTALIYLPPERRSVGVDLGMLSGRRIHAYRFDPSTGSATDLGTYPTHGTQVFTVEGESDWVLVLDDEARHYGPPGGSRR